MSYDLGLTCHAEVCESEDARQELLQLCQSFAIDEVSFVSDVDIQALLNGLPFEIEMEESGSLDDTDMWRFASVSLRARHASNVEAFYSKLIRYCKKWKVNVVSPETGDPINLNQPGLVPPGY